MVITRKILLTLMLTIGIQACSNLPSIDRADHAYANGDYESAREIYSALAKRGFPDAQIALGDMYFRGLGVTVNRREGRRWYATAAESGDTRARQRYAKSLIATTTTETADPRQSKAILLRLWEYEGKETVALDLGHVIVDYPELGTAEEAEKWLTLALSQGQVEANYYLGLLYSQDAFGTPDIAKAKAFFVAALDSTPLAAHELLALYSQNPELGDLQEILENLISRQSFSGGKSAYHLGSIYDRGELLPFDARKAEQFYLKAVDEYPKAILALANLYAKNPDITTESTVFEWIDRAEKSGFVAQAQLLKARILYEGKLIPGEPEKAENIYLRFADESAEACYHLGLLYRLGYLGESNYPKSFRYFLQAARLGYESGDFQIGDIFVKGRVIKPDPARAYAHYSMAANAGHERAKAAKERLEGSLSNSQRSKAQQWMDEEMSIREDATEQDSVAQLTRIN
ncbi:MAG: hypothetical protein MI864_02665 [Pseudomonadales bacterium]|nr:hypothetical protein [Pseudomonadales bacterium]